MADQQNDAEDKVNYGAGITEEVARRVLAKWEAEFPPPRKFNIALTPLPTGRWLVTVGGGDKPRQLFSEEVLGATNLDEAINGALAAARELVGKVS